MTSGQTTPLTALQPDSAKQSFWESYNGPSEEMSGYIESSVAVQTRDITLSCGECEYLVRITLATTCTGNTLIRTNLAPLNGCLGGWAFVTVYTPAGAWFAPNGGTAGFVQGQVAASDEFEVVIDALKLTDGTICEGEGFAIFTDVPEGIHIADTGGGCFAPGVPLAAYVPALTNSPANYPVRLIGNLRIDQPMITSRDWYVNTGNRIYVPTGGEAKFLGSEVSSVDCNDLWHGFIVEGTGKLSVQEDATIRDAVYGIYGTPGSNGEIDIANAHFLENYVGVYTLNNTTLIKPVINSEFSSPSYKPYLSECLPYPNWGKCQRGYAGFVADHGRYVTFAQDPGSNRFQELANGMVFTDNRLNAFNTDFTDIAEPCYGYQGGVAVLFTETPSPNNISGVGWAALRYNRFEHCDIGIHMADTRGGSVLVASENTFSRIWQSIVWNARDNAVGSQSWGLFNEILEMEPGRYLPARGQSPYGLVLLTDQDEAVGALMNNNYIESQMDNAIGMYLLNVGAGLKPAPTKVIENYFSLLSGDNQIGIFLENDNRAEVTLNSGAQFQLQSGFGIRSNGGSFNKFCENEVFMGQDPSSFGIFVENSPYISITNNAATGGWANISVQGTCLPGSIARNVTAGASDVAILHTPPGSMPGLNVVGDQYYKENVWLSPGVTEVRTFGGDLYYVPAQLTNSDFNDQVVQPGSSDNLECGATSGEPLAGGGSGGQNRFAVASPNVDLSGAAIGELQMQEVAAYRALINAPTLTATEQSFLTKAGNEFPGFYHELERLSSIPTLSDTERAELQAAIGLDSSNVMSKLGALDEAQAENLVNLAESRHAAKVGNLRAHLASYSPQNAAEARVLAVLAPLYSGNTPTEADMLLWRTTAEGCHTDFGLAVDLAASAYTSHSPSHERLESCKLQQLRRSSPSISTSTQSVSLMSTLVSQDELTLVGDLTDRSVAIVGSDGRQVAYWHSGSGNQSTFLVGHLAPGLYFLQVEGQEQRLKFVKQ